MRRWSSPAVGNADLSGTNACLHQAQFIPANRFEGLTCLFLDRTAVRDSSIPAVLAAAPALRALSVAGCTGLSSACFAACLPAHPATDVTEAAAGAGSPCEAKRVPGKGHPLAALNVDFPECSVRTVSDVLECFPRLRHAWTRYALAAGGVAPE